MTTNSSHPSNQYLLYPYQTDEETRHESVKSVKGKHCQVWSGSEKCWLLQSVSNLPNSDPIRPKALSSMKFSRRKYWWVAVLFSRASSDPRGKNWGLLHCIDSLPIGPPGKQCGVAVGFEIQVPGSRTHAYQNARLMCLKQDKSVWQTTAEHSSNTS